MPQVIATPINGARVRKPDGQILCASGETVERDSFWLRRAADGDVTLAPAAPPPAGSDADNVTPIKPKK